MSVPEELGKLVKEYMARVGAEVEGCLIARSDGLVIYSDLPGTKVGDKLLAANTALIASTSRRICKDLLRGELKLIVLEGENGKMVVKPVQVGPDREVVIAILTNLTSTLVLY